VGTFVGREAFTCCREITLPTSALAHPIRLSLSPAVARRQVEAFLDDEGWPGDAGDVVLAVHEALVNAGRHGGGARWAEAGVDGDGVVIHVADRGSAFDPRRFVRQAPDPMAERGRGLWLICHLATSCEIRTTEDGNEMIMRFARP
jgi:anti-sigma regulatory factor (Ser/Thr protein kinase)